MMKYLTILLAALSLSSCLKNDIPYPVVKLEIKEIKGEGFTVSSIDLASSTVTITLDEATDIRNVKIDSVYYDAKTYDSNADTKKFAEQISPSRPLTGTFDMRSPIYVRLELYQTYDWTIVAVQPMERQFTVAGQIGATEFDAENRTATALIRGDADLKKITVTALKLGPADITTYSPTLEELSGSSFESVRLVDVTCHGVKEQWMLYVIPSNAKIAFSEVDLWNNTGTITALITEDKYPDAEIEYRVKGTEKWQKTQKGQMDANGIFTGSIEPGWKTAPNPASLTVKQLVRTTGVYAGQTYECRLVIGDEQTELSEYTAPAGEVIPDGNMENKNLSCFTSSNEYADFWASGNNSFAPTLCSQEIFPAPGGSNTAKLKASSPPVVDLAAGNLMSGTFYKENLTTGAVEFGQPYAWKARPTGMKVKYHATIGIVDKAKHSGADLKIGDQDKARLFVAIVDWNTRHRVASGTSAPTGLWDPERMNSVPAGKIIAYGSIFFDKSTEGNEMVELTLPLNFYDTTARPAGKYTIVISSATSAYGDYMVGCSTNVLYLDDFEWVY